MQQLTIAAAKIAQWTKKVGRYSPHHSILFFSKATLHQNPYIGNASNQWLFSAKWYDWSLMFFVLYRVMCVHIFQKWGFEFTISRKWLKYLSFTVNFRLNKKGYWIFEFFVKKWNHKNKKTGGAKFSRSQVFEVFFSETVRSSLVMTCFEPQWSDVDFVNLCAYY